ncbi:hypothetical protein BSLG_007550 [Batrachochytrium salamandrivorans]|nr:hypothetical protein BSLG_007550 [Batrachochytrium salamandrivorans]
MNSALEPDEQITETVKLISADGFEFVLDRKYAMASGTIKNMLSSPVITLPLSILIPKYRAIILEKVCRYLYYKVHYANTIQEIPEFPIEPEIALELLMASDFLDC